MSVRRILLVEDDEVDRLMIDRLLGGIDTDIELTEAEDVQSALEKLEHERFDAGLFDLRLPDGDAFDLLDALETHSGAKMPVVILTGNEDKATAQRALSRGAQDYLLKDEVSGPLLVRSLRYALERKRAQNLWGQAMHSDRLKALGRLAAGIAHEVNNPATYLRSNLELMQRDVVELRRCWQQVEASEAPDVDRVHTLLEGIDEMIADNLEGINRIAGIVSELGVFARFKRRKPEPLDLSEVVEKSLKLMHNELTARALLELDLQPVATLEAHRNEVAQIVTNLLINAADALDDASSGPRKITVRTRQRGDSAVLEVQDTGPGIPEHVRDKVFDPFFTTKDPGKGTGLGLSVCAQIVKAHQGSIELESSAKSGTLVRVILPCDNAGAEATSEP